METVSPPVKVVLLCLAAVAHWIAMQPPNPPASKQDIVTKSTFFEQGPRIMAAISRTLSAGFLMAESAVILALYFGVASSSGAFADLCPASSPSLSNLTSLSPIYLSGLAMIYTSGVLRVWCYKTLGTLFTYEITIRPNHKLITSGPYAYVRHPGYTANVLMLTGTAIVCFGSGSYVDECGIMPTPVGWFILLWTTFIVYWNISFLRRGGIEDEGLRKVFGDTWDRYSRVVPCRYVPGVF